jgi:hypothetical protein
MHWIDADTDHLEITVEDGMTLRQLIDRVQAARERPLEIHELAGLNHESNALCGLWLPGEQKDIILHAPSDSALHREQFVLHELAHMILKHDTAEGGTYVTGTVLPGMDSQTVVKALGRDSLGDRYEVAAERLADTLATMFRRKPVSKFSEVFG